MCLGGFVYYLPLLCDHLICKLPPQNLLFLLRASSHFNSASTNEEKILGLDPNSHFCDFVALHRQLTNCTHERTAGSKNRHLKIGAVLRQVLLFNVIEVGLPQTLLEICSRLYFVLFPLLYAQRTVEL